MKIFLILYYNSEVSYTYQEKSLHQEIITKILNKSEQTDSEDYLDTYRNRQSPSRVTLVTEGRVTDAESEGLELYIETGPGQSGDLRVSGCPDSGLQSSYNLTHRYTLEQYSHLQTQSTESWE